VPLDFSERGLAVLGLRHAVARALQVQAPKLKDGWLVVNQENDWRFHTPNRLSVRLA
jgi:hypothetical protein